MLLDSMLIENWLFISIFWTLALRDHYALGTMVDRDVASLRRGLIGHGLLLIGRLCFLIATFSIWLGLRPIIALCCLTWIMIVLEPSRV